LNFVVISRAATCDAELIFFCTLPIYLFVRGTATGRICPDTGEAQLTWNHENSCPHPDWRTDALVYGAMGIAVLVKGPIGVVLPTSVLGLFLVLNGALAQSRRHTPCAVVGTSHASRSLPIETLDVIQSGPPAVGSHGKWRGAAAFVCRALAPSHVAAV